MTAIHAPQLVASGEGRLARAVAIAVVCASLMPLMAAMQDSLAAREGYGWWWGHGRGIRILWTTVTFALAAAVVGTTSGWLVAGAAARLPSGWGVVLLAAACVPMLVPSSLVGTAWIMALGQDAVITNLLRRLLGDWPWTVYRGPVAPAIVGTRFTGLAAMLLYAHCRRRAEWAPVEQTFGIRGRAAAWHLRLAPAARPVAATVLLLLPLCMNDHILPSMFLINTYGTQVLIQYNALMDAAGAAALSAPLMLLGIALAAAAIRLGHGSWKQRAQVPRMPVRVSRPMALFAAGWIAIAVGIPLVALGARMGSWQALVDAASGSRAELMRTAWLAAVGGTACALLAAPLALAWERGSRVVGGVLLNAVVPPSLLAMGVLGLFDRWPAGPWRNSDLPLIVGYTARFLPVALVLIVLGWSRQAGALRAARVYRPSRWSAWALLVLPVRGPAVLGAGALSALLIGTELEVSVLLTRPGTTTLGVRLYSMIHTAPDSIVSALAIYVLLVVLACVAAAGGGFALWRRRLWS